MLYIAQRWLILTWSVQNIKNMCKNWKGFYWLTRFCEVWDWDEFWTDIRLHWTAPLEPDFFQLYRVTRPKPAVTEICARGVFFLSLLQSNMKSCAIFEIHRWSILLISILLISMIAPLHIFMLYIHPWTRVVFHVQLHQLVRYTYPNIFGVFTAESLT